MRIPPSTINVTEGYPSGVTDKRELRWHREEFPDATAVLRKFLLRVVDPGDSYAASLQPRCGIDLCAVLGNLEVQVRAGGLATVTHGGDLLAGVDALAGKVCPCSR